MRDLVTVVAQESVGVIAGVSAVSADGGALDLELLALPLVHRGRTDVRVLGALAPTEARNWIGIERAARPRARHVPLCRPGGAPERRAPPGAASAAVMFGTGWSSTTAGNRRLTAAPTACS